MEIPIELPRQLTLNLSPLWVALAIAGPALAIVGLVGSLCCKIMHTLRGWVADFQADLTAQTAANREAITSLGAATRDNTAAIGRMESALRDGTGRIREIDTRLARVEGAVTVNGVKP